MMKVNPPAPSHDALSAMPGDWLCFNDPAGMYTRELVKTAGWQPSAKGGREWTYETIDGTLVPNTQVLKVEKVPLTEKDFADFKKMNGSSVYRQQDLYSQIEKCEMSATLKVVMYCLLKGDAKNLEVAGFLITERAQQLKNLESNKCDKYANP